MRKFILILIIHCLLLIPNARDCIAQSITWQRVFVFPGDDQGRAIIQTLDGGYAFVGKGVTANFCKLDVYGNLEWQKNYTVSGYLSLNNIIQLNDSSYVIGGSKLTTREVILIKTSESGDTLWTKIFSYNGLVTNISSLKILSDGGFIICGDVLFTNPPGFRAYAARVDSNGNLLWHNDYMELTNTFARDIVQVNPGNYYYTSSTYNTTNNYGSITKLSVSGKKLWDKIIFNNNNYQASATGSILIEGSETLVVDGIYDSLTTNVKFIGRFDTAGNRLWMGSGYWPGQAVRDMHKALNGDYIFTGLGGIPDYDVAFLRVNTAGSQIIARRINSSGDELDNGIGINRTNDNGAIIVGYTTYGGSTTEANFLVIKIDSSGYAPPIKIVSNTEIYPKEFNLYSNYPNPFNPTTKIKFEIPLQSMVTLKIYDILGREAAILCNGNMKPGSYEITWDAAGFSSGEYFVMLIANGFRYIRKIVYLK